MSTLLQLASRKPGLAQLEPAWRLLEDVLAGRIKSRGALAPNSFAPAAAFQSASWSSTYLPQGRLESATEYALRLELTPFFPETPRILAGRLGALLKQRPHISGLHAPELAAFLKQAGRRHARFEDLLAQAASLTQVYGFCAALLDREPLPPDAATLSQADVTQRQLGRPYLALYGASEILDWEHGPDGELAWVKFGEPETNRANWNSPSENGFLYRIVDREKIQVYHVRAGNGVGAADSIGATGSAAAVCSLASATADGVLAIPDAPHIFPDPRIVPDAPVYHGLGKVPVVFCHPFPGLDGLGRPLLQRCAEADLAATRILSDLVWDLFLLGNPILTYKSNKSARELEQLGLGASRYIPLSNGRPGIENEEKLEFVQLDPTGLEMLFKAYGIFSQQASKQAGLAASEAGAIPREQSGVAKAWEFKTGEERLLFLLARALEPFLTECLQLAALALNIPDRPIVKLPESFDVSGPSESIQIAQQAADLSMVLMKPALAEAAAVKAEQALAP